MAACSDCSGSGLETLVNGQVFGRCRVCKGVGRVECVQLGELAE